MNSQINIIFGSDKWEFRRKEITISYDISHSKDIYWLMVIRIKDLKLLVSENSCNFWEKFIQLLQLLLYNLHIIHSSCSFTKGRNRPKASQLGGQIIWPLSTLFKSFFVIAIIFFHIVFVLSILYLCKTRKKHLILLQVSSPSI